MEKCYSNMEVLLKEMTKALPKQIMKLPPK